MRLQSVWSIPVILLAGMAGAQNGAQPARTGLVATIVTDRNGEYIRDLNVKDFRVWQDGKEQRVTGAAHELGTGQPEKNNYMLALFDNSTTGNTGQREIKAALAEFVGERADLMFAVAVYSGGMSLAQNFTPNAEQMRKAIESVPPPAGLSALASLHSGASITASDARPRPGSALMGEANAQDQTMRAFLLDLAGLARGMNSIPRRKALVLLTEGFTVPEGALNQFGAAVNACNQANVAIYPVDLRDLNVRRKDPMDMGVDTQDSGIRPRQALDSLAAETGGFVIRNSNDLVSGLRKIAAESGEYYAVSFAPAEAKAGCHALRVKVSRSGAQVRARSSYCVAEH